MQRLFNAFHQKKGFILVKIITIRVTHFIILTIIRKYKK
jgi:hypothetical protein